MDHSTADNSGHIFRVTANIRIPPGHSSLGIEQPIAIPQYAHCMTVARGRLLYEVVDHLKVLGYVLPADIASEAVQYGRRGDSIHLAWANLASQEKSQHYHAHNKVPEQFSRIDHIASRIVAERLITHGTHITHVNIEQAVVDHAGHIWTSYRFRLEQGEDKRSAIRAIRPRLREVLTAWLGRDVREDWLMDLWHRWDLLDDLRPPKEALGERLVFDEAGHRRKRFRDEFEVCHITSAMTWYAGEETVANLKNRARNFS